MRRGRIKADVDTPFNAEPPQRSRLYRTKYRRRGSILSGEHRCGRCCLLGKHFCSRVLAHLINGERSAKYYANNEANRRILRRDSDRSLIR